MTPLEMTALLSAIAFLWPLSLAVAWLHGNGKGWKACEEAPVVPTAADPDRGNED